MQSDRIKGLWRVITNTNVKCTLITRQINQTYEKRLTDSQLSALVGKSMPRSTYSTDTDSTDRFSSTDTDSTDCFSITITSDNSTSDSSWSLQDECHH